MRSIAGRVPIVKGACFAPLSRTTQPHAWILLKPLVSSSALSTDARYGPSLSNRRIQVESARKSSVELQLRRYAVGREVEREDKRETKEELERLEIKEGRKSDHDDQSLKEVGKLLTTPSRLFKLLIPLPTAHHNSKHTDAEPIAILVHPQQPLSYLERLIQNELPRITIGDGKPRAPAVAFIALQIEDKPVKPHKTLYEETDAEVRRMEGIGAGDESIQARRRPHEDDDTYSYLRRDDPKSRNTEQRFVRWSESTEIGDFVRDASRAQEFIVNIEGAPSGIRQIHVAVPSFDERTHFLRMRLRNLSGRIRSLAEIKNECDALAQRGAQRVAMGGFGILLSWWWLVYMLTFQTDLGWDTMEPVTYLASLSTLMGGYLWFLYHNREISYRSALDFTINARQKKLYQMKGIDLQLWETLIDEGNTLRKEIKSIAAEYEVYWDEMKDERDKKVTEALKKERNQKNGSKRSKDKDDDDDE